MQRLYVTKKNETVRMFKSDFVEFFSHVHPITPLVLYLPVIAFMIYLALHRYHLSVLSLAAFFVAGAFVWTLLEYIIHRYVFHYQPKTHLGKQFHFIVHGVHHDYPNDSKRLVMPPVVSIPLAVIFFSFFFAVLGRFAPAVGAGFVFGYVCYDTIHYAIHHFAMKKNIWRWLKNYHLRHHFHDDHAGYGVSSPLWDFVFRTTRK
jgi:4-hydroxysphinganine ceramide fatty acyl 2-hydroxylase